MTSVLTPDRLFPLDRRVMSEELSKIAGAMMASSVEVSDLARARLFHRDDLSECS